MQDHLIIFSSLLSRKLNVFVSTLLVAAGISLCVILLAFSHHLKNTTGKNGDGVDLVIGAKGSPLQLVLSSVYHLDIPTGNIPAEELQKWDRHKDIAKAIPLALGDSYKGYRIVGTTQDYLALYGASLKDGVAWNEDFDAVAGSATGLKRGDSFHGAHGLEGEGQEHEEHAYNIIGTLKETGTLLDRLILTSVESVQELHAHHAHEHKEQGEITAILLQTRSKIANINLPRKINSETSLMAANPAYEMTRLSSMLGIGGKTLAALSAILLSISLLGVFAGLSAAMEGRMTDLAVLRALGFSRPRLVKLIMGEGLIVVISGIAVGVGAGYAGIKILESLILPLQTSGGLSIPCLPLACLVLSVLAAGLIACAIPAWRISKINVAEQLARGV